MREQEVGGKEIQRLHTERQQLEKNRTLTATVTFAAGLIAIAGGAIIGGEALGAQLPSSLDALKSPLLLVCDTVLAAVSGIHYLGLEARVSSITKRLNGPARHTRK
jgi:hypothetical protein